MAAVLSRQAALCGRPASISARNAADRRKRLPPMVGSLEASLGLNSIQFDTEDPTPDVSPECSRRWATVLLTSSIKIQHLAFHLLGGLSMNRMERLVSLVGSSETWLTYSPKETLSDAGFQPARFGSPRGLPVTNPAQVRWWRNQKVKGQGLV